MKGTKLGIVVKSLEEGSKNMITDGKRQFVAADKKRTSVTMVELERCFQEHHPSPTSPHI